MPSDDAAKTPPPHVLSFSIPCFNCARTVVESLDSIYQQKLTVPFEILCTDDCSTDATRDVLEGYRQTHPELQIFYHQTNRGGGAARNTCVSHARGDLIFNLDSDNVLEPGSVNRLIALIDQSGCDIAVLETIRYFHGQRNQTHSASYTAPSNVFTFAQLMSNTKVPPSGGNYLFTKESYVQSGGYPENLGAADTWGFGYRQLVRGFKMALLKDSFYWHRLSNSSYWVRDHESGRLQETYYSILEENPEIFTSDSFEYLLECKRRHAEFDAERLKGRFVLIPAEALEHLFKAYRFERQRQLEAAIQEYNAAISLGADKNSIRPRLVRIRLLQDSPPAPAPRTN